jgi:hypothetical protein
MVEAGGAAEASGVALPRQSTNQRPRLTLRLHSLTMIPSVKNPTEKRESVARLRQVKGGGGRLATWPWLKLSMCSPSSHFDGT